MRELREAACWQVSARWLAERGPGGRERFTVVVAQCIHAIIRANDALTMRFLGRRAARHDDAVRLFHELVVHNKLRPAHARLKGTVRDAVQVKSKVDYKGEEMSRSDAMRWLARADRFLEGVEEALAREGPAARPLP